MKFLFIFALAGLVIACGTDTQSMSEPSDGSILDVSADQLVDAPDSGRFVPDSIVPMPVFDSGIGPVSTALVVWRSWYTQRQVSSILVLRARLRSNSRIWVAPQ